MITKLIWLAIIKTVAVVSSKPVETMIEVKEY